MPKVTFLAHDGSAREIEAAEGVTLMEAAVENLVPGIDGDCGGACACATCHIHIEPKWRERLPPMEEHERAMLQFSEGYDDSSRLGCQIPLTAALDGIVVKTPLGQH
jgi:2Fe-2S ferredoxin